MATGPWLDLVSLGLGVLAVALGAWYVVDNWLERERRYWADKRIGLWPQAGEAEEPTGVEEILAASPGPVVDVFGYVSDSRHDIRLRIVVGLFAVDIALQVIANV